MQISKAQEAEQMLTFSKMTGIGNDYIYVNCFQETVVNPEKLSIFMSDVRFGVGSERFGSDSSIRSGRFSDANF